MILRRARIENGKETELTVSGMIRNSAGAARSVVRDIKRGERVLVTNEEYESRMKICYACENWKEDARLGLGKCNHVKCGCTRLKQRLASQECPDGRWRKLTT